MKLFVAAFLTLASLSSAFAGTPEVQQSLSTLKTALSFVNMSPRDKEKINLLVSDLELSIGNARCGATQDQLRVYTVVCRSIRTFGGATNGYAEASSTASLQAALANAKDAAFDDCVKNTPDRFSCENSRMNDNYQCHEK